MRVTITSECNLYPRKEINLKEEFFLRADSRNAILKNESERSRMKSEEVLSRGRQKCAVRNFRCSLSHYIWVKCVPRIKLYDSPAETIKFAQMREFYCSENCHRDNNIFFPYISFIVLLLVNRIHITNHPASRRSPKGILPLHLPMPLP